MILIYEHRVSVGNDEVILDVKGGDGHTIMWMNVPNATNLYLYMVKMKLYSH